MDTSIHNSELSDIELKKIELLNRLDSLIENKDKFDISNIKKISNSISERSEPTAINATISNDIKGGNNDLSIQNNIIKNNNEIVEDELNVNNDNPLTTYASEEKSAPENNEKDIEMKDTSITDEGKIPAISIANTVQDEIVNNSAVTMDDKAIVVDENVVDATNSQVITWDYNNSPKLLTHATETYSKQRNNFIKGCKWSPDGTCLLTNSDDNHLRLFNTPFELYEGRLDNIQEMSPVLKMFEGDTIYDYCWSPLMTSSDPSTCLLISSARASPVHMWDAFTGKLVSSYRSFDLMDEPTSAYSVCFTADGGRIIAGFDSELRVFDVERPGRDSTLRKTHSKKMPGQNGLLACMDASRTDVDLIAVGSYLRSVCLYDLRTKGGMQAMFNGQVGGVTQVKFSTDGHSLYSGGRKDSEIICWDLRNYGRVLYTMKREVLTNQRLYFDIDSTQNTLVSASHDGKVKLWDLQGDYDLGEEEPLLTPLNTWTASTDCINGVSCHPFMPVIATCSGQRHIKSVRYADSSSDSDDSSDCGDSDGDRHTGSMRQENSVKLWYCGTT